MDDRSMQRPSLTVLGVLLVILGGALLVAQVFHVDVIAAGWPLFVLVPGIAFFVGMLAAGRHPGLGYLAIPGSIITTTGLLFAYQNLTGDWASWSYAWAFVAPGAVGLGLLIAGAREGAPGVRRTGAWLLGLGLALALVGEWFFVRLLGVGGLGFGPAIESLLPLGLIVAGVLVVFGRRSPRA